MTTDVRSMLQAERSSRRVKHPHASYHPTGQLFCTLCNASIKSVSSWESHLGSETHAGRLEEAQRSQVSGRKRKFDDSEDHDRKRQRNGKTGENNQKETNDNYEGHSTPLVDHTRTSTVGSKPSNTEEQKTNREVGVDQDEWTAFERDMEELNRKPDQEGPLKALEAAPTISAAPISAAEIASQAKEEQSAQRGAKDREIDEERDEAAQQAEEEMNRMAQLDEKMARLRERRDALRHAAHVHQADVGGEVVKSENAMTENSEAGRQEVGNEYQYEEDEEDDFDEWQGLGGAV